MSPQFHSDPDTYVERIRAAIPRYDELQGESVAAITGQPQRILELGTGTGETTRRIRERFPDADITGLDASPDMVFRARGLGIVVRIARMEDPLPDGPWDLMISVLSVHNLNPEQKRDLYRRARGEAKQLVIGDVFEADPQVAPLEEGVDFVEPADELAKAAGGEVVWSGDDLAVIRAQY
jgi:tRNA (cmo5U34)-methyltransferase